MKASSGKPANRIIFATLLLAFSMLAAPGGADTRVDLKYPAEDEISIYTDLLMELQANLQRDIPTEPLFRRKGLLSYGLVDLNGDGTDEVLVHGSWSYSCGNSPSCDASVYMRKNGVWNFIGEVGILESLYPNTAHVFVGGRFHQGWRTLNAREYRYCWVKKSPAPILSTDKDQFLMPHVPGQPGYFWNVLINEECPMK